MFRRFVEEGRARYDEWSHLSLGLGYLAASMGVPFLPTRSLLCSDLLKTTGAGVQNDLVSVLYYRMKYGRVSPQSALISGSWQQGVPKIYAQMQAALERWDREAGRSVTSP